jgi:peptidoglycan/LPS O-acetylase OafA/YrhL
MIDASKNSGANTYAQNADFMRLVFASCVLFSHSFLIAEDTEANEPFVRLLGAHNILGIYAVMAFLIMSGYFVAHSLQRSSGSIRFLLDRFLRIYPGLLVSMIICALLLAPFFSHLGIAAYLRSNVGWSFVGLNFLLPNSVSSIPSVQFYGTTQWLGAIVNGSLWTIPVEISCYLLIFLLHRLRLMSAVGILVLLGLTLAFQAQIFVHAGTKFISDMAFLLPSFLCGVLVAFLSRRFELDPLFASALAVLCVMMAMYGNLLFIFPFCAAYPIMYLATTRAIRLPDVRPLGDLSYGAYLYGWPVQQTVRALWPGVAWYELFAVSLAVTLPIAWLSWRLIEEPALRLKKRLKTSWRSANA